MLDNRNQCQDRGPAPLVVNMQRAVEGNSNFRTTLWTGKQLQLTLMCIPVGCDIGVELHKDTDQFLRIESGCGLVMMGCNERNLKEQHRVDCNCGIVIPAGTWHNIVNVGEAPLKLYSLYAPPEHPFGTIHKTKKDAH